MSLSPEDRWAIHEIYTRYTHTLDSGQVEEWAELFTPDGGFRYVSGEKGGTYGRDVLIEWGREWLAALKRNGAPARHFHLTSNLVIEETEDGAHGKAYVFTLVLSEEGIRFSTAGFYDDDLVLAQDGWRFAERRFHQLSPEGIRGQFLQLAPDAE